MLIALKLSANPILLKLYRPLRYETECAFVTMIETTPFSTMRNCFRCGKEFQSGGGNRICSACCRLKEIQKEMQKTARNPNLSFRERQVVNLVCKAKQNKEIAYELHLTEGTIKEYLNRIFRKLGVSNRTQLAVWALTDHTRNVMEYVA